MPNWTTMKILQGSDNLFQPAWCECLEKSICTASGTPKHVAGCEHKGNQRMTLQIRRSADERITQCECCLPYIGISLLQYVLTTATLISPETRSLKKLVHKHVPLLTHKADTASQHAAQPLTLSKISLLFTEAGWLDEGPKWTRDKEGLMTHPETLSTQSRHNSFRFSIHVCLSAFFKAAPVRTGSSLLAVCNPHYVCCTEIEIIETAQLSQHLITGQYSSDCRQQEWLTVVSSS